MDLTKINNRIPAEVVEYANAHAEGNHSLYASFLQKRYGEIVERVFAFRRYKKRDKHIVKLTEVVRRDTSGKIGIYKNLTFAYVAGYSPQYEAKNRYTRNGWGYRTFNKEWFDVWEVNVYGFLPPMRSVINPEMLLEIPEFKYCGYRGGDVIHYLREYRKHKGIEFFGKLDIPLSPVLIKKCESDKSFCKYLCRHHNDVRSHGIRAVIYAYNHNLAIDAAKEKLLSEKDKKTYKQFKEASQKAKRLLLSDSEFALFLPQSPDDLVKEGDALSHCVGRPGMGYAKKHSKGESIILFLREAGNVDKPYVTVEYKPKEGRIAQQYGYNNSPPTDKAKNFLKNGRNLQKMSRVIIRFKDGEHLNIPADCIDIREGWVIAWRGEDIVVIAKAEGVEVCYLSEKKE